MPQNAPNDQVWSKFVLFLVSNCTLSTNRAESCSLAVALVTHREHPDGALQVCGDNPSPGHAGNAGNGTKDDKSMIKTWEKHGLVMAWK